MNKLMAILTVVSIGLLVLCLLLVYVVIDSSVSLDHARSQQREVSKERSALRQLTLDLSTDMNKSEIRALLASKYKGSHIVKEEDANTIFVDGVGLRFQGDDLTDIVFMSEGGAKEEKK